MASLLQSAAAGGSVSFRTEKSGQSDPVFLESLDGVAFVLHGASVIGIPCSSHGCLQCIALDQGSGVALLTNDGDFLSLDSNGRWHTSVDLVELFVTPANSFFSDIAEPEPEEKNPQAKGLAVTSNDACTNSLDAIRQAYHEKWLKQRSGKHQAPQLNKRNESNSWASDEDLARQLQLDEDNEASRIVAAETRDIVEPEAEPSLAGWGEGPGERSAVGQMMVVSALLHGEREPVQVPRLMRSDPNSVHFTWVERMALCVGNAGHDARNNLRFAAVALEKRHGRIFGSGGLGPRMGIMGMGMGMGCVGGVGLSVGRIVHGAARIEENPNHPRYNDARYFQKIDALSGELEGLCRGIVTKARQARPQVIRSKLIPAAMSKVEQMEDLTTLTAEAELDEMQRVEMIRIIALQRRYLEALEVSLAGSTPRPGLPKPDETLDFSVANSEVSTQLEELTSVVETKKKTLDAQQLIMLARMSCNTGHQLQNLAAFCAEDPSCCEVAQRIDNLGGEIENRSRSIMVVVHHQEDSGMIPMSSRQNIAKNCVKALDSAAEIAHLAGSYQLQRNPSAAEMFPTLARLRKSASWLHDSAIQEMEAELSFGFGLFGPTLPRLNALATASTDQPAIEPAVSNFALPSALVESRNCFDVAVLGGGPAGIAAAEAALERGMRCAIIEPRRKGMGTATGFNSKVAHASITEATNNILTGCGIGTPLTMAGDARHRLWQDVVRQRGSKASAYGARVEDRLRAAGAVLFQGTARFVGTHELIISSSASALHEHITANFVVICTGARPRHAPRCPVDGRVIHDYKTIEEVGADSLPSSAIVLGGGIIACETACYMAEFGVFTTLLAPRGFMKDVDPFVAEALADHLQRRRGVKIHTDCEIRSVTSDGRRGRVDTSSVSSLEADVVVVAMGSVPNTEWLGLEAVPLRLSDKGAIEVDGDMRSSLPHIFSCGDCCSRGGLLSLAKRQGLLAVAVLHADRNKKLSKPLAEAPVVIWTIPEIAMVGNRGGRTGFFDIVTRFSDCDRGAIGDADDAFFLKIVYEMQNLPSEVYVRGVHIFGPHAEKLICRGAELVGKTLDDALGMILAAAVTFEELYTINLQAAAKRTVDLRAQHSDSGCMSM